MEEVATAPSVAHRVILTVRRARDAAPDERVLMHDTGIVRRIDDLGRIVIPMELRRTLGISVKDPLAIFVDGDRIILQKHRDACAICGDANAPMIRVRERPVCEPCAAEVKKR